MGAAYFAAHRAPRTHLAPDVTRQVSARITSDGGWIPRPVARTSSPRVHGSGFVVCRTRARWDRAHQGYVGHTRGRTRTSITRSRAPSLRSERAVAPANPGELCSFTASRAPNQTTSACPVCVRGRVLQVRKGICWSIFLTHVGTRLNGICASHKVGIQCLCGLAAATVSPRGVPQRFGPVSALLDPPVKMATQAVNKVPTSWETEHVNKTMQQGRQVTWERRFSPSRARTKML